ncbi:MAG: 5-methyltetrahydropteroyltriglutamate--homocysteine methyltransferase [Alphaproteobacteria bacterium]|jgi:5-methyltetrahydropteroyltriglutamate--homocysteine methyltransferase|nr:5-methyltetrahydropteroyltriglutamate--homocysteine methyltransferase [Alphaproteobacteria bacterium]
MSDLHTIRTDVVGSLLRPAAVIESRKALDEGKLDAAALRAVEDEAVRAAVKLQEGIGLDVISDGEVRRLNFQDSFGAAVEGFDASDSTVHAYSRRVEGGTALRRWEVPVQEKGTAISHRRPVKSRLRLKRNVPLEEYKFVAAVAKTPAKVSLIGPDRISQRFDHQNSKAVYKDMDAFMADVVSIEREIIASVVAAGCRYVHIDAPGYTAYVDEPSMNQMRERGEDPAVNFTRSLKADAAVIADFPGVTFGIHLCRGNQRSMWHREGSYDAIAERLFTELPHHRFLLEYDSPRAGSFAPLRFLPKGKVAVLGLVSTKVPEMENVDALKRRIDEAAKVIPVDQLAISPQCGFASDVVGNLISVDDQKRKLEIVVETARQVWG